VVLEGETKVVTDCGIAEDEALEVEAGFDVDGFRSSPDDGVSNSGGGTCGEANALDLKFTERIVITYSRYGMHARNELCA
jgi:hypothetical protein